jgi:hypothetical protein
LFDRAFYRIGQLRRALDPQVSESERAAARNALGERLYPLFDAMQPADQRHCLDTFEQLLAGGHTDDDLLAAALLHDCGKGSLAGAGIGIRHRVGYVLLVPVPPLLRAACRLSPGLAALRDHGELSVSLVREYGAPASVVELVEQAEGMRPLDDRGRALKRADDLA